MTITVSTPITGVPQTGMAAPSFTVVQDSAVNVNSRRWVVTSVTDAGGTNPHTIGQPFYVEFTRPAVFKTPPMQDATFGRLLSTPARDEYHVKAVKGVLCGQAGQVYPLLIDATIKVPSGATVTDSAGIRAVFSLFGGFINEDGDGIGDVLINGTM